MKVPLPKQAIARLLLCLAAGMILGVGAGLSSTRWIQLSLVFFAALVGVYAGLDMRRLRRSRRA